MKYVILLLFVTGCTVSMVPKFKCQDGVIYMKDNGAWIQAKMYEANKCLPLPESGE